MAKKKSVKKKSTKKTPIKRAKNKPKEKEKKKGMIGSAISKIPTSYKVKGGRAKYKSALGESEVEYDEVKVGKQNNSNLKIFFNLKY